MNQSTKIGLAAIVGFTVGFAFIKVMAHLDKSTAKETPGKEIDSTKLKAMLEATKTEEKGNDSFPLRLGSQGEKVERLQVFLMRKLGWIRKPNGVFDLITKERTQKYFKEDTISQELYEKLMLDKMIHDQRIKKAS